MKRKSRRKRLPFLYPQIILGQASHQSLPSSQTPQGQDLQDPVSMIQHTWNNKDTKN